MFRDADGREWSRYRGGIEFGSKLSTWVEVRGAAAVRVTPSGVVSKMSLSGVAQGAKDAWAALIGTPLPADLAPAHHWSFVCTPERVDIARVYREMAAQGVDRNDVKIAIRPHGKKNLRVAVSSRGAQ